MSKRISKETRKRLKRNRHRRYKRKMALRNQPRTTQERADAADAAAEAMRWDDVDAEGFSGSFTFPIAEHQVQALRQAFKVKP